MIVAKLIIKSINSYSKNDDKSNQKLIKIIQVMIRVSTQNSVSSFKKGP